MDPRNWTPIFCAEEHLQSSSSVPHHLDSELLCYLGLEPLRTTAKWGMKRDSP